MTTDAPVVRVYFTFLIRRPRDTQPWPATPFANEERALAYPFRCSSVVRVELLVHEPVNTEPQA
jgi:hypothetical protein